MALENEAAFDVPDGRTARRLRVIEELAGMPVGTERVRTLRDTYLDTPRQALRRAGWSLRRREEGGCITLSSSRWIRRASQSAAARKSR